MWSSQSIATSDEEFKYDTWNITTHGISSTTREFMSIDPCIGVPNVLEYLSTLLYFTVICLLCVILMNIQSFMISIARHLLHYIAQYYEGVFCLFTSKIKPHKIFVHDESLQNSCSFAHCLTRLK